MTADSATILVVDATRPRSTTSSVIPRRRAACATDRRLLDGLNDPAVQTELRSALTAALEELPDHYRAVVILHDVDGLAMAEVADCLDITVATAKSRAHRARLALRRRLAVFMAGATSAVEMARKVRRDSTLPPHGASSRIAERRAQCKRQLC